MLDVVNFSWKLSQKIINDLKIIDEVTLTLSATLSRINLCYSFSCVLDKQAEIMMTKHFKA